MQSDVSEDCITSIFRVENQPGKKPACSRFLGTYECELKIKYQRQLLTVRGTRYCQNRLALALSTIVIM
jgi:hypothetical protein